MCAATRLRSDPRRGRDVPCRQRPTLGEATSYIVSLNALIAKRVASQTETRMPPSRPLVAGVVLLKLKGD